MPESPLTAERILAAAEDILRRYGPAKATVSDLARALGVSHGSIYRYFDNKSALRDAVIERWLAATTEPLIAISQETGPAPERLGRWLRSLVEAKHRRALDDPEFFATYLELMAEAREVIQAHVESLVDQVTHIVADGCAQGAFTVADPAIAARAVLHATARFHSPAYASEWKNLALDDFEQVWALIAAGLSAPR